MTTCDSKKETHLEAPDVGVWLLLQQLSVVLMRFHLYAPDIFPCLPLESGTPGKVKQASKSFNCHLNSSTAVKIQMMHFTIKRKFSDCVSLHIFQHRWMSSQPQQSTAGSLFLLPPSAQWTCAPQAHTLGFWHYLTLKGETTTFDSYDKKSCCFFSFIIYFHQRFLQIYSAPALQITVYLLLINWAKSSTLKLSNAFSW